MRMWYDIQVFDGRCGWLPVNIKTTTTKTSDNAGNLSICVQAYTDKVLDLNKSYNNGELSKELIERLKSKQYNRNFSKDYYYIVINKKNQDIIVNSIRGLSKLTPNENNLPFQIKWNKNTVFVYHPIIEQIEIFIKCYKKSKTKGWKEIYLDEMAKISER